MVKETILYDFKNNKVVDDIPNSDVSVLTTITKKDYSVRHFGNNKYDGQTLPEKLIMYFGYVDKKGNEIDITDLINSFFIPDATLDFSQKNIYKWINIINHSMNNNNKLNVNTDETPIEWSIITNEGDMHDLFYFKLTYTLSNKLDIIQI